MSDLEKFRKGYAAKRAKKNKEPKFNLHKYLSGKRKKETKQKIIEAEEANLDSNYSGMVPLRLVQEVGLARCDIHGTVPEHRPEKNKVSEFIKDVRGAQMIFNGD